jgi:Arc/MetJ family transcription regulator
MRVTLDLPDALLAEACAVLGVTSTSEAVELALLEVVKRSRPSGLKALLEQIHFEFDPCELRHRERARLIGRGPIDVRGLTSLLPRADQS